MLELGGGHRLGVVSGHLDREIDVQIWSVDGARKVRIKNLSVVGRRKG